MLSSPGLLSHRDNNPTANRNGRYRTMTAVPDYQYDSLVYDSDIRLIKLFPAKRFQDPVRVSIEHHESASSRRFSGSRFDYWDIKHSLILAQEDAEEHWITMPREQHNRSTIQNVTLLEAMDHGNSLSAR
jgi:hypothetical protein